MHIESSIYCRHRARSWSSIVFCLRLVLKPLTCNRRRNYSLAPPVSPDPIRSAPGDPSDDPSDEKKPGKCQAGTIAINLISRNSWALEKHGKLKQRLECLFYILADALAGYFESKGVFTYYFDFWRRHKGFFRICNRAGAWVNPWCLRNGQIHSD